MITAQEANARTVELRQKGEIEELTKIELAIDSAIRKGDFRITLNWHIKDLNLKRLIDHGYTAHTQFDRNDPETYISW